MPHLRSGISLITPETFSQFVYFVESSANYSTLSVFSDLIEKACKHAQLHV